jgi:methionyl-tRNA formyltransferase
MTALNIVFAGTPAFALPCLDALAASKHHLKAIYTQPDRPAGRGRKLQASAVKEWAYAHHLPIYQPLHFKQQDTVHQLERLSPDVMIVIAYGLILPQVVLDLPRWGCINVHASLLPRWRGASPIQQAILQGDTETGVTIMQMDAGLDTGAILTRVTCPIDNATSGELQDHLAQLAASPLLATLDALSSGTIQPQTQDNLLATYAPKINKDDALINWQQPAIEIDRQIRAFHPWPIAYTRAHDIRLRIHEACALATTHNQTPGTILSIDKAGMLIAAGSDAILVQRLQFPGAKAMSVAQWLNANRDQLHVDLVLQ